MVYLLLKMTVRGKDFMESGSALLQLALKSLKFRSVVAAGRQIWGKEEKPKCLWRDSNKQSLFP